MIKADHPKGTPHLPAGSFTWQTQLGASERQQQKHYDKLAADYEAHYSDDLCFFEPHSGSFPDIVRRVWYRFDRFFEDNEASIDITRLQKVFGDRFELRKAKYLGNIAFLLVLNSLIFRIPVGSKKYFSPALMKVEALISNFKPSSHPALSYLNGRSDK